MTKPVFVVASLLVASFGGCAATVTTVQWCWGAVMPEARSARATCAAGQRIITVGGTSWPVVDGKKVKRWHRSVFAHHVTPRGAERGWSRLPDYPLKTGYAAAFAVRDTIVVVGGRDATTAHAQVFTLNANDTDTSWQPGPALPGALFGLVGGVIEDTIYVTGGFASDGAGGHRPSSDVLALDLSADEPAWHHVGQMPRTDLAWPMATTGDGRLFVFGGSGGGVPLDLAWAFDPADGTWRPCRPMPEALSSGAASPFDRRHLLVAGGSTLAVPAEAAPDGKARTPIASTCLLYDTRRDRYRLLTPMPQAVLDQGLVVMENTIYSFGGEESPHRTRTDLMQVGGLE